MCAPSPPDAPDLVGAANATAQNAVEAARIATTANRVDQYTPLGSQTFTQGVGGNPDHWASTINLNPVGQQKFDLQQEIERRLSELSKAGLGQVANVTSQPFNTAALPKNMINAGQTAQDAIMARIQPDFDRRQRDFETQMANQGIARGSEAYTRAADDLSRARNDAVTQAALTGIDVGEDARIKALQEQQFLRAEPLNMVNALRTGTQVQMPSFQGFGAQQTTPGADILGATMDNYQNQLGIYNANQASNDNLLNGLFGVGSAMMLSDPRLKTNVVKVGEHNGLNVYEYDIFGERQRGVMADEVLAVNPDAVYVMPSGYLAVNYGAL